MSTIWRDGKVHVRATACDHCLLGGQRLVSGERARQIVAETRTQDGATFICHRSQVSDDADAICGPWFERFAHEDAVLRLAVAMRLIERT